MRWRLLGSLLIVIAAGWLLAGAAADTFASTESLTYPASFAGASWIQAPGGPQAAYFRLSLNLPATPDLATLWIDGDQQYQVYADDTYIAHSQAPVRSGLPRLADPVDLSWKLHKGVNGIGVKVVNGGGHAPAALFGQLTLDYGGKQVTYGTSPASWLAAPGAPQVSYPGTGTKDASFSSASFDPQQWTYSVPAESSQAPARSLVPAGVVAGPLTGAVISAGASHDMRASSVINVPGGARDGWLRVISADAYTLSVDGQVVTDEPAAYFVASPGTRRRPQAAVNIYDIRPYLQAGPNPVLLHVYGSGRAAVYLDGVVDTGTGPVRVATGRGWQAAPSAGPATVMGPVARVWPKGVRRSGVTPDLALKASTLTTGQAGQLSVQLPGVPTAISFYYTLLGVLGVAGLWLGTAAVTARVTRRWVGRTLLLDAAGHLPVLFAAAALGTLARLPNWVPPWPYEPAVFWLLVAILAAGKLVAAAGPGAPVFRRLRDRRPQGSGSGRLPGRLAGQPGPRARAGVQGIVPFAAGRPGSHRGGRRGTRPGAPARFLFPSPFTGSQAGTLAVRLDGGPGLRPAQRASGLPAGLRGFAARAISGLTWTSGGVIVVALAATGQLVYRLGYQPYSGDETVSVLAAQSIRAHFLPRFPSGMLYLKGELYEYPLAVYTAIFGTSPVALRLITAATYGATILAFGLLLLPVVLRGRHRITQVALTLLFATAPMELQEAQLVRMYQQEQLFGIMFIAFFLIALRAGRVSAGLERQSPAPAGHLWSLITRWSIPLCAVTLLCMYLSLEESFILLPAIPVVLFGGLGLRWLRDRQWIRWGLPAVLLIGIQYSLTLVAKMPVLGYDNSNKPYVYYDPSNIYYYWAHYLLAIPGGTGGVAAGSGNGTLYLITILALLAGAMGIARRDFGRLYLSAFAWLPILVLSTLFTAHAGRYIVIVLPMLFALAGLGALDILRWLRVMLTAPRETRDRRLTGGLILAATVPALLLLAASMPARIQDYGLAASRLTGVPYSQSQPDYTTVAAYLKAHEQPGDLFIVLGSGPQTSFYTGRPPDMVVQPHPNKLLFLTQKDGIVVEDYYGRPVILTADDLQQVIAAHHRIWLMTDQGTYFDSVPTDMTDLIRAQFTEVAQGTQSALYFKGD